MLLPYTQNLLKEGLGQEVGLVYNDFPMKENCFGGWQAGRNLLSTLSVTVGRTLSGQGFHRVTFDIDRIGWCQRAAGPFQRHIMSSP